MAGGRESAAMPAPPRRLIALAIFATSCFLGGVWVGGRGGGAGGVDSASMYKLARDAMCPPVNCDDVRGEADRALSTVDNAESKDPSSAFAACPPPICPPPECPKCERETCPPCERAPPPPPPAATTTAAKLEAPTCPPCDPCPISASTPTEVKRLSETGHTDSKVASGETKEETKEEAEEELQTRPPSKDGPPKLSEIDDPRFDWTNIVDDALASYPSILKEDVDSAEITARNSVNAFRGQIIDGRLFIKDVRSLQFARDYAPSWKITLLETMRRHRDLPNVDIVYNEGDYPIVQIPKDGAHQQRLYGRGTNGMKPPPVFSPTQSENTKDIPFPDFSFSPPGTKGEDRLNTNRWAHAHVRVSQAGRAIPFGEKIPLAAFTGNTQAGPRQKLVEVAKLKPEYVFVNQVFKKAPKGKLSCVQEGKADKGGFQENECALSFEEMCRYRYLVNVGSNGYANKLKYLFLCGSVVITVRDGMPNREFFERQFLPGVHYVAVAEAKDIPEMVKKLEANPKLAASIAARGTRRMLRFDMEAVTDYVAHLIREYAKRQRFNVKRLENTVEIRCEDDLYHHYDHNGGLKRYITEDESTCIAPWPSNGTSGGRGAGDGGGSEVGGRERVPIPCDVAFDLKEVPDACPGMKWHGWGPRCLVMECKEWMPDPPPPPPLSPPPVPTSPPEISSKEEVEE